MNFPITYKTECGDEYALIRDIPVAVIFIYHAITGKLFETVVNDGRYAAAINEKRKISKEQVSELYDYLYKITGKKQFKTELKHNSYKLWRVILFATSIINKE